MKNLLSIVFVLTTMTVEAQSLAYIYDDATKTAKVTYNVDENKNRIVYPSTLTAIPEKAPNGYRVTAIGSWALAGCKTTELTIPASVVKIEDNAVNGMSGLKKLVFADGDETLFLGVDTDWGGGGLFSGDDVMEEIYVGRNLAYDEEQRPPLDGGGNGGPKKTLLKATIGEKVTTIPYKLFYSCEKLQSITIGSNVTTIGTLAFYWCKGLERVVLPEGLTTIKGGAFEYCSNMSVLQIPSTLKEIGPQALSFSGIETLTIPAGMEVIGDDALQDMSSLKKLIFEDSDKPLFIGVDNIVATGGMFNGASVMEEIYVGRNLTYDEEKAVPLYGGTNPPAHSLLKAVIGEKVTRIPYGLFNDCRKLNEVVWGSNVIEIGERAFWGCLNLGSIVLPKGITVIKPRTFANCSSLTSIQLPPNLVELGEEALYGCKALEEITIPGSIETFGARAFIYSGLKRITIADSNGSCYMPYGLFSGTKLTDFYLGKNVTYKDASNGPFSGSIDYQTTDFVIGSLVTKIGDGFFVRGGGQYAVNVRFGSSVKSIGSNNFQYASKMETITCEATTPPVCADEKTIFTNVNKETCQLIVPATSIEAYRKAPVWKEFFNIQALPETKCAIPTANIVNGKLVFQCATEGVEFHCEYDYPKGGKADGNNIVVSQALTVRVYATKAGLDDSDVATYQLVLGSGTELVGDANRDGVINAADIVTIVNIIMGK